MPKKAILSIIFTTIILFSIITSAYSSNILPKTFVGPARGQITSLFGWRSDPFNGNSRFHCGLDIAGASGSPVYALQEGYITFTGDKGGYGKTVIISHQYSDIPELPKVETMYSHNSKLLVQPGQYVRRGDIISLMGSTGRSTGPHLHFEVHYNGGYVNPIDYLIKLPKYLNYVAYKRSNYYASGISRAPQLKPHITAQQKANYVMLED
jgi:murein DD-endopeptidase MepM/ murein hydrolase activator NlpD